MGVYIKGMEMPKVAGRMEAVITIRKDGTAQIAISPADDEIGYWKEYPLVPVPPHGRLIDADELIEKFNALPHRHDTKMVGMVTNEELFDAITYDLTKEPTIIPADKEGE